MELKRYIEANSKVAMAKIMQEHGDNALIISSEKVGNKTEVIVGIETQSVSENTKSKPSSGNDDFKDTMVALKKEPSSTRSKAIDDQQSPWGVLEQMNQEISQIKSSMANLRAEVESQTPVGSEIDQKIANAGFNLESIENRSSWDSESIFIGLPGAGKSVVIDRIIDCSVRDESTKCLVASVGRSGNSSFSSKFSGTKMTASFLNFEDLGLFSALPHLARHFDQMLIEISYEFLEELLDRADLAEKKAIFCLAADSDLSAIPDVLSKLSRAGIPVVLTRLDLCANLPEKLSSLVDLSIKVIGTSTGSFSPR